MDVISTMAPKRLQGTNEKTLPMSAPSPRTPTPTARPSPQDTRERLIRAGEHLFARKGLEDVTSQELTKLAGQRNASVIQYHFGSRDGLIEAISTKHQTRVDELRRTALERLGPMAPRDEVRAIIRIIAQAPMTYSEEREDIRDWLRITPLLIQRQRTRGEPLLDFGPRVQALYACLRRIMELIDTLPRPILEERLSLLMQMLTLAHAERAIRLENGTDRLAYDAYVENHVEMLTAGLHAPAPAGIDDSLTPSGMFGEDAPDA